MNYSLPHPTVPYPGISSSAPAETSACLPSSSMGVLPSYLKPSTALQSTQLPAFNNLFSNVYSTAPNTFNTMKDQTDGLVRGCSTMSNLSCSTALPQLSSECLSSTNSEDSLLGGLNSSPCYQSSYSGGYISPFTRPNSPVSMPVSPSLGNSALLEQTAAMMKAATAALQSLQSQPQLHHGGHSPQKQQQPAQALAPLTQQHCYASTPAPAAPSRGFLAVQTAPSMASIGMQALEELMMGESSQDSSPFNAGSTLQSVQSAPASLFTQASQPWGPTPAPCTSQPLPAHQDAAAQRSMNQMLDSMTQSPNHDTPPAASAPPPKARHLKRSVSDITVFDCKAAAAAVAAKEAAKAFEAAATPQVADQATDFADLDLPLLDDCFLADMGSSDLDSDITSGLCFDGLADFQQACPSLGRSDSSNNLLAEPVMQLASDEAAPAAPANRKGKQSKKLKARGGVAKTSSQVCIHFGWRVCCVVKHCVLATQLLLAVLIGSVG